MSNFKNDLEKGQWAEFELIPFIENYFTNQKHKLSYWYTSTYDADYNKLKNNNWKQRVKEYDLRFGLYKTNDVFYTKKIDFEIKTDFYDRDTGNVCVEIKCSGKASGIMTTKADYFIYWLPRFTSNNLYIIKTEKLKQLIEDKGYKEFYKGAGDNNRVLSLVIPKSIFNDDFIKAGGRIENYNTDIPQEYNLTTFQTKKKNIYYSDDLKKYDDELKDFINGKK